jgi:nucleoside-diphosphate kinase
LAINLTKAGCARRCRFEQKGFKLVGMKMVQAKEDLLKEHYKDLVSKPFFPSLLSYMTSGPVVPMIWEGDGVVKAGRVILGATKPSESAPGTVRGDYAIDVGRNVCHGSDAVETAVREIGLWFRESRLASLLQGV